MARRSPNAKIARTSAVIDTKVICCGDNLDHLSKLPDPRVDLIYIDPPFSSNRNYEVFWDEKRGIRSFDDRHASTQAYIEFMRRIEAENESVAVIPSQGHSVKAREKTHLGQR